MATRQACQPGYDAEQGRLRIVRVLVVGYHGCDQATCDALVAGKTQLRPSSNPYDWLGDGIYFFEGDWRRALKFAVASCNRPQDRLTREPVRSAALVGAILRVGDWLDMSTQKGIEEFARTYRDMISRGRVVPPNKQANGNDSDWILRRMDRQVFNQIHNNRKTLNMLPYDAVRGPFPQGNPVAPSSSIRSGTHVQIALRNSACVLGYFAPIEAFEYRAQAAMEISVS